MVSTPDVEVSVDDTNEVKCSGVDSDILYPNPPGPGGEGEEGQ